MTTLITADPTLGPADSPADYDKLSSGWSLGTEVDDAWHSSPVSSLLRGADQMDARYGPSTRAGTRMFRPDQAPAMLSPDQANEQYGVKGELSWDKPVRESEAKLLNGWKRDELQRQDVLNRATPGAIPATARFLAGAAASAFDPINAAASFIPVFGEARWAELAGTLGTRLTRVARGAAEGFVGSAAVEPITYGQAQNEQADYDGYTALKNIAFGTLGGAGLHAIGGEIGDALTRDWRRVPRETREAALRQGSTAITEGAPARTAEIVSQPINVVADHIAGGGTLDPMRIADETGLAPEEVKRSLSALATNGSLEYSARTGKFRRVAQTGPLDVISFLQSKGGISDTEGHDLLSGRDAQRQNPRFGPLVRKSGMSIDAAGEQLHEAGYFGDPATSPRPSEAQVLDLLDTALSGKRAYSVFDASDTPDQGDDRGRDMAGEALDRAIEEQGVSASDQERAAALDLMMTQGVDPADALDQVLERSSIEGGVYQKPEHRLAAVEAMIEDSQSRGASLADIAPMLDEREALRADIEAARTAQQAGPANVVEQVQRDLTGEDGGSAAAVAQQASDNAEVDAREAPKESERLTRAKAAAAGAETKFRTVAGLPEPELKEASAPEPAAFEEQPVRRHRIPDEAVNPIASLRNPKEMRAHPDFEAAKGGDVDAAAKVTLDLVKPETIEEAGRRFGPDAIYAPVVAAEGAGRNRLPRAIAELYAAATGATTDRGIVQATRASHTGAGAMERILARPTFDGPVVRGGRYVLVDDVSVMGGTTAALANHIIENGGHVAGIVNLVNASRLADHVPQAAHLEKIERLFGDELRKIGIEPNALTAAEAGHLASFKSADSFRDRVAKARRGLGERGLGQEVQPPAAEKGLSEPPTEYGRLSPEDIDALHAELAGAEKARAERDAVSKLAACMIREGV